MWGHELSPWKTAKEGGTHQPAPWTTMKACGKSNSWPPELAGGSTLEEDSSLRLQSIDREPEGSPMASLKCRVVAANTGSFSVSNSLFLVIAAPPDAQSHCIDHVAWIIKKKGKFAHKLHSRTYFSTMNVNFSPNFTIQRTVRCVVASEGKWFVRTSRACACACASCCDPAILSLSLVLNEWMNEKGIQRSSHQLLMKNMRNCETLITAVIHQAYDANFAPNLQFLQEFGTIWSASSCVRITVVGNFGNFDILTSGYGVARAVYLGHPRCSLQMVNLISKVYGCYSVSFHVLQLLPIRFTQQNLCYKSNLRWSIYINWIDNRNFPDFIMVIGNACLVVF